MRCLIVDDSEDFLLSASRLLVSQGVDVVGCAVSGGEAMSLAATLKPDVALVDVQLGDDDGFKLAVWMTANVRGTRIILISTHSEADLLEMIAESPAVGFLPKSTIGASSINDLLA